MHIPWTDDFVDILRGKAKKPRFRTRAKMAWDDEFFHIRFDMEESHVWGALTKKSSVIYQDNDIEVFIDPQRWPKECYEKNRE